MTRTAENADRYDLLEDDIKFMKQYIKVEEQYRTARDTGDAAARATAFDEFQDETEEGAAGQPDRVPKVTSVARLASRERPKGKRVKKK